MEAQRDPKFAETLIRAKDTVIYNLNAEVARLRAENTVLRGDLDRLLALADVIRRNRARDAELAADHTP
jgi:hypothetical protein